MRLLIISMVIILLLGYISSDAKAVYPVKGYSQDYDSMSLSTSLRTC